MTSRIQIKVVALAKNCGRAGKNRYPVRPQIVRRDHISSRRDHQVLQCGYIHFKWIYHKNANIHDICIYHTSNWTGEPAGYARDIFMTSRGHVMTSSRDLEMIRKITNTFLASVKILGQLQGCIIPLLKALFNAHLWWNSHYMYHASLYVKKCLKILFFHIFYTKSHFSHP